MEGPTLFCERCAAAPRISVKSDGRESRWIAVGTLEGDVPFEAVVDAVTVVEMSRGAFSARPKDCPCCVHLMLTGDAHVSHVSGGWSRAVQLAVSTDAATSALGVRCCAAWKRCFPNRQACGGDMHAIEQYFENRAKHDQPDVVRVLRAVIETQRQAPLPAQPLVRMVRHRAPSAIADLVRMQAYITPITPGVIIGVVMQGWRTDPTRQRLHVPPTAADTHESALFVKRYATAECGCVAFTDRHRESIGVYTRQAGTHDGHTGAACPLTRIDQWSRLAAIDAISSFISPKCHAQRPGKQSLWNHHCWPAFSTEEFSSVAAALLVASMHDPWELLRYAVRRRSTMSPQSEENTASRIDSVFRTILAHSDVPPPMSVHTIIHYCYLSLKLVNPFDLAAPYKGATPALWSPATHRHYTRPFRQTVLVFALTMQRHAARHDVHGPWRKHRRVQAVPRERIPFTLFVRMFDPHDTPTLATRTLARPCSSYAVAAPPPGFFKSWH